MISTLPASHGTLHTTAGGARRDRLNAALSQAEQYWEKQQRPTSGESWAAELAAARTSFLETNRCTPSEISINYQRDAKLNRLKALYAADFLDISIRQLLAEAKAQLPAYSTAHTPLLQSLDRAVTSVSAAVGKPLDIDFTRYLDAVEAACTSPSPGYVRETSLSVLLDQFPDPLASDLLGSITTAHNSLFDQAGKPLAAQPQAVSAVMSVLMPGTHTSAGQLELQEHAARIVQQAVRDIRAGESEAQAIANLRTTLPKSFAAWIDAAQSARDTIATARVPLTGLNPKVPHPAPETLSDYALEQIGIPHLTAAEMREANEQANRVGFTRVNYATAGYLDPASKAAKVLGIVTMPRNRS